MQRDMKKNKKHSEAGLLKAQWSTVTQQSIKQHNKSAAQ